jgi:hypothetical protein
MVVVEVMFERLPYVIAIFSDNQNYQYKANMLKI